MSQRTDPVEFIRLNGQAIRVTSWTETGTNAFRLVAVVRGVGDINSLARLFEQSPLELEIPGKQMVTVHAKEVERRNTGDPPISISRFVVLLETLSADGTVEEARHQTTDERLDSLEREVAALRRLLESLTSRE